MTVPSIFSFTNDMIQNKTFYVVGSERFEEFQVAFQTNTYTFTSGDESGSDNFFIDSNGSLNLGGDAPVWKLISISNPDYYKIYEIRTSNGTWTDETSWFDSSYPDHPILFI